MSDQHFDTHDWRVTPYACADGITRHFRPFSIKDMLRVRRALPKIATDMPWLNFANFESPNAAVLRTLAEMAATLEADLPPAADAAKADAVRDLCAAIKNAHKASSDNAGDEAIDALMEVFTILFSPDYCDQPLTRAQLENSERGPITVADVPALMDIAVGLTCLEKKAKAAGTTGQPSPPPKA